MDDPLIKRLESNRIPTGVDPRQYYRRYLENSPRLFIARGNVEHVEVFRVLIEKQCQEPSDPNEMRIMGAAVELRQAENYDVLEKEIRINRLTAQHSLYLLQQGHSWDRFRISKFSLERILTAHHVFLPFFDLIQAYGVKNHEDHHNWTGHRSYISKEPAVKDEEFRYEFCYNLQYMEKNNRRKGDPWSLRQSGVYQQISVSSRRSTWIILQPSNGVRAQLEQALENSLKQGRESDESAIYFHVIFLSSMAGNWQEYLEYLHSQIIAFDEKACFSRVGVEYDHEDYALTFSDCQNLQLLRQKLLRTSSVLDACLDVTSGCADHCIRLTNMKLADPSGRGLSEIVYYKRQLLQHRQTIGRITQQAAEAGRLLSKILEFRNDKTLQTTLSILQNLFSESREDHKLLLELARQSQKDSRTLKAFSSVATMYLPASLIATIFSSSLIRTELDVTNSDSPHYFAVSSKFWLFFLSSVSLSFLTFAFIMLVQRIWQRHSELLNGRSQP